MTAIKIILIILLSLIALLCLIAALNVRAEIIYNGKPKIKVGVLFVKLTVYPPREKEPKKEKERDKPEEPKKKQENIFKRLIKDDGIFGFLDFLKGLASIALGTLKRVYSHCVFTKFKLDITAAGEDAAAAAMNYGKISAALYPTSAALLRGCKSYRHYSVTVTPDFTEGKKIEADVHIKLKIRIFYLLCAAVSALIKYIKLTNNKSEQ